MEASNSKRPLGAGDLADQSSEKRMRIDSDTSESDFHVGPSDVALLYNLAYKAWEASNRHLPQAFIPAYVENGRSSDLPPIHSRDPLQPSRIIDYRPDSLAAARAIELALVALDALGTLLRLPNLSDKERVTAGLLFGKIAHQTLKAQKDLERLASGTKLDSARLLADVQAQLAICLGIARRIPYLTLLSHEIEVVSIRILLLEGRQGAAKKMVKQAIEAARDHPTQIYALQFLLIEHEDVLGSAGVLAVLQDTILFAREKNHTQIAEVLLLARVRLHFHRRRWDLLPTSISEFGQACGWSEANGFERRPSESTDVQWAASMAVHYLLLRCLLEDRLGQPRTVRRLRKEGFALMDEATEKQWFAKARYAGGLHEIIVSHNGQNRAVLIQGTPPNLLYMLTYHVGVITSRDMTGKAGKVKALVYANGLRETEGGAYADDMWDIGFSMHHGIDQVMSCRRQVELIRAETMLEQTFTRLYRSDFDQAHSTWCEAVDLLRHYHDLGGLLPHVLLLRGQLAHLLGQSTAASQCYRAAMAHLLPGSELGMVLSANLFTCEGYFDTSSTTELHVAEIRGVMDKALASTNTTMTALGTFLSGLVATGVNSKSKYRSAWEATHMNGDRVLYGLLFAFLVSIELSDDASRVLSQLETGRDLAASMGGIERADRVGQGSLGMWYATRLYKFYKGSDPNAAESAKSGMKRHAARNTELMKLGVELFQTSESS